MNDQPPPTTPYGYPPQGHFPTAPKKSHTLRNVLLIVFAALVLLLGGCLALVGSVANEVDKAMTEEVENDKPKTIAEGAAFAHDGYAIADGWSVKPQPAIGGATIEGLRVTLEDDQDVGGRTALLTFRLYRGSEVRAEIECQTNEMQEGESSRMKCFSLDTDPVGKWQEIRVADMW